jgi:hypothetical protein
MRIMRVRLAGMERMRQRKRALVRVPMISSLGWEGVERRRELPHVGRRGMG